jgi:hypothetical protein
MIDDELEGGESSMGAATYHPYRAMAFAVEPSPECAEARRALVCAITAIFCCGFLLGPLALRMGQTARLSIADNPETTGVGMANAAIVIGKIAFGLHLGLTLLVLGGLFFALPGPAFHGP